MMKINSHTQLGAMPSQLTFQQHKILCVNYRLASKYKTKWPKPGEKDLLTMLGWKKGQAMVHGNKNNWTLNHPYSQPCVRNFFSPSFVLQPVKNHIVFIKKCSENLSFKFNKNKSVCIWSKKFDYSPWESDLPSLNQNCKLDYPPSQLPQKYRPYCHQILESQGCRSYGRIQDVHHCKMKREKNFKLSGDK